MFLTPAWIGQAIIAEFSGEDTILNSFQHSVNVSRYTLAEASYGLALATMRSSWTATLDEAAFALHKLVEKFPSDWVVINLLGIFRERSGQLQLAADAYRKAANCSPEGKRALVLVNLARCITALGDSITAQRIYDNIPADQFDALTLLCKGIALYHCGSLQESFQLIERVLKTDNVRTRSEACLYLSQVLFELGEAEKATQYLLEWYADVGAFDGGSDTHAAILLHRLASPRTNSLLQPFSAFVQAVLSAAIGPWQVPLCKN